MAIITKRRKAYSVVYQKVDENGVTKQIWETYYDYSSALVRKREIENEGIHIKMNIKPNTTILNFLVQYATKIGRNQWSSSRYESNMGVINNYISQVVGSKKIKDIKPNFAIKTMNQLEKTPAIGKRNQIKTEYIPNSMLRSCYMLLKTSFDYLVSEQLIENNPFHEQVAPKYHKNKPYKEWNLEFVQHLFESVDDMRLFIFLHIMFSTGLDIREIGGLSWHDIHISDELIAQDQCYLCSNKILDRLNKNTVQMMNPQRIIKQFECAGFTQTNTSLILFYKDVPQKTVHIHKQVALLLRIWKERQKEFMVEENPYALLITLINGKPCDDRNMTKLYHKTCAEANLKELTLTKFKSFSKKESQNLPKMCIRDSYATLKHELSLPKPKISTTHVIQLNQKSINSKIQAVLPQQKNEDMNLLIQQIKDNPELKMKLIAKLKAEL